jgi:hypothetical protein
MKHANKKTILEMLIKNRSIMLIKNRAMKRYKILVQNCK